MNDFFYIIPPKSKKSDPHNFYSFCLENTTIPFLGSWVNLEFGSNLFYIFRHIYSC